MAWILERCCSGTGLASPLQPGGDATFALDRSMVEV
jgi:hypothetical protein